MDFNQLLSIAKKNQEKNDLKARVAPKVPEIKKKSTSTPVFCKPFVPPPPVAKKEHIIAPKDKSSSSKSSIKTQNITCIPEKFKPPKPSFSDLLLLAKKNVDKSNSNSLTNSKPIIQKNPSLNSIAKKTEPKCKIPPVIRSINDVKFRPGSQIQKPTKPSPISMQNNNIRNVKPAQVKHAKVEQKQPATNIKVKKEIVEKQPIQKTINPGNRRHCPAIPQPKPQPNGVVRSGIAAQLGCATTTSRNKYSNIEDEYYDSEEDYDSDFIDDSEDVDDKQYNKVVKIIQKTMNFDPSKYEKVSKYDDLNNMESSYRQVEKENARSARLGAKEDKEDILMELEKKRRRAEKQ